MANVIYSSAGIFVTWFYPIYFSINLTYLRFLSAMLPTKYHSHLPNTKTLMPISNLVIMIRIATASSKQEFTFRELRQNSQMWNSGETPNDSAEPWRNQIQSNKTAWIMTSSKNKIGVRRSVKWVWAVATSTSLEIPWDRHWRTDRPWRRLWACWQRSRCNWNERRNLMIFCWRWAMLYAVIIHSLLYETQLELTLLWLSMIRFGLLSNWYTAKH